MTGTPDSSPQEQELNEIIAGYLEAIQAGMSPDRQELLAQYPDSGESGTLLIIL